MSLLKTLRDSFANAIFKRWEMEPLTAAVREIRHWFASPLGRMCLAYEQRAIAELLRQHRGQRILQISPLSLMVPKDFAPFKSIYRLQLSEGHVESDASSSFQRFCVTDFQNLPFEDESIDIVVVHHVLEFSLDPQSVLKEAGRVTSSGGHIVVVAFNPASITGLLSILGRLFQPNNKICARKQLLALRVKDWLRFLDFSNLKTRNLGHEIPFNHSGFLRVTQPIFERLEKFSLPFANVYCLLARKDKAGLSLLAPDWKTAVLKRALVVPKPAQSVSAVSKISKKTE